MKAKVKTTGEIVDVELAYKEDEERATGVYKTSDDYYFPSELDFNIDTPQKQSVTIEGWVAKHFNGKVTYYDSKPICRPSLSGNIMWKGDGAYFLPSDSFPDLKCEDEPRKVRITIEEI